MAKLINKKRVSEAVKKAGVKSAAIGAAGLAASQESEAGVGKLGKKTLTAFEKAHLTAQKNAALPIEQGGLGLPPDNTAMDRARAMGFDVENPVYHGTASNIEQFSKDFLGNLTGAPSAKKAFFFTDKPFTASQYARAASTTERGAEYKKIYPLIRDEIKQAMFKDLQDVPSDYEELLRSAYRIEDYPKRNAEVTRLKSIKSRNENLDDIASNKTTRMLSDKFGDRGDGIQMGGVIYPVLINKTDMHTHDMKGEFYRDKSYSNLIDENKENIIEIKNTYDPMGMGIKSISDNIYAVKDPSSIRSYNAAFDPLKRNSPDLLGASSPAYLSGVAGVTAAGTALTTKQKAERARLSRMTRKQQLADVTKRALGGLTEIPGDLAKYAHDVANFGAGIFSTADLLGGAAAIPYEMTGNLEAYQRDVQPYVQQANETQSAGFRKLEDMAGKVIETAITATAPAWYPAYQQWSPVIGKAMEDYYYPNADLYDR